MLLLVRKVNILRTTEDLAKCLSCHKQIEVITIRPPAVLHVQLLITFWKFDKGSEPQFYQIHMNWKQETTQLQKLKLTEMNNI